jgi:hypothetical protein
VNTVKLKPVSSVPVSTGIASSTAAASENGVSLFRVKIHNCQHIATDAFKVKLGDTPCEPTVARRREEGLIRAIRVGIVRATAKAGRAVRL